MYPLLYPSEVHFICLQLHCLLQIQILTDLKDQRRREETRRRRVVQLVLTVDSNLGTLWVQKEKYFKLLE